MSPPLLLALALLSADPPAERLLSHDISAGVGVRASATSNQGYRNGDALLTPTVTGRGVWSGFTVDGSVLLGAPITPGGTNLAFTGVARAGYTGARWSAVAGVWAQWVALSTPAMQFLPSLRGQVDFGPFGMSLGVFDIAGQVPLHVSAELGDFSLGYAAPLGLVGSANLQVTQSMKLRVQAFAFKLGNDEQAMLLLSGAWGGAK